MPLRRLSQVGIDGIAAPGRTRQTPAANPGVPTMIVDAQVHLWKPGTPERPWLPNRVARTAGLGLNPMT